MTWQRISTLRDHRPSAVICRERGWVPGTRLVGDEGQGPTIIEITAVGERSILAKTITHNGKVPWYAPSEGLWALYCRDWQPLPPPPEREGGGDA